MNNELYHHGILGQKWGVRRTPEQLGHRKEQREVLKNRFNRSAGVRSTSVLKEARSKDINKLSNQELRDYNERLNLEQNFVNLTKGNIFKGKEWVAKTVVSGIVVGAVATVSKKVVSDWLKKKFGIE